MVFINKNQIIKELKEGKYVCPICQQKITSKDSKETCKWCKTKLVWF